MKERVGVCVHACFHHVRGLSWPGGQPFAIFIVGNAATVKSNWELYGECI